MVRAAILAWCFSSAAAFAAGPTSVRIFVDVFGTRKVASDVLEARFTSELSEITRLATQKRSDWEDKTGAIRLEIERRVLSMGDFSWVQLGFRQDPETKDAYFIFEIVERKDTDVRMPFRRPPRGTFNDPDGLLQAWSDYMEAGAKTMGAVVGTPRGACVAYYCPWGSSNSQLRTRESKLAELVPRQRVALEQIMAKDEDPLLRAKALFLLSYLKESDQVMRLCVKALADPDEHVRDAAMRIFTDIALRRPGLPIPVESITAVLGYPYTEDRTRAMAVLLALADKPAYRPFLVLRAAPQILQMLRLKYPTNHQMAYMTLGLLSRESHGDRQYDAWETWWSRARMAVRAGVEQEQ